MSLGESDSNWWKKIFNIVCDKKRLVIYCAYHEIPDLHKNEYGSYISNIKSYLYETIAANSEMKSEIEKLLIIDMKKAMFNFHKMLSRS